MIRIENTEVYGWEAAIRGMRNPMNSWEKSDSKWGCVAGHDETTCTGDCVPECTGFGYKIGDADLTLMKKLAESGSDHRKFMRMIVVTCDVTAPLYWWSEYDTYKVGTVANSCSKMHTLMHRPFEMNDFSFDKLPGYRNEIKQFRPEPDEVFEEWRTMGSGYEVSNHGRIRNQRGRILGGSLHKDGYIFVTIHGRQIPLHRLIAQEFCDGKTDDSCVNHIDGNKQNNFASNLEWVTQQENIAHSIRNGLQPKTTRTYLGKFTSGQRQLIKDQADSGEMSRREIAALWSVSHTCISDIVNDKYKYAEVTNVFEEVARPLVDTLNELRDSWTTCWDDVEKKKIWYSIIQLLPSSYNQRRTVLLNYEVLRNIYHARKNHKLDEWHTFCEWIETLPYAELIKGGHQQ